MESTLIPAEYEWHEEPATEIDHDCDDHLENTDIPWVLMCSECGSLVDRFEK